MSEPAYKRALREVQIPYVIDKETGEQKPIFNSVDVDAEDKKAAVAAEKVKLETVVALPIVACLPLATKILEALTANKKQRLNLSDPADLALLTPFVVKSEERSIEMPVKKTTKKAATKKATAKKPAKKKAAKK